MLGQICGRDRCPRGEVGAASFATRRFFALDDEPRAEHGEFALGGRFVLLQLPHMRTEPLQLLLSRAASFIESGAASFNGGAPFDQRR